MKNGNLMVTEIQNHKLKKIRELKQEEYGSFNDNMNSIGVMWSALLGLKDPIPGWMVSLMYVASKLIRSKKRFKADNYDDAANYLLQARIMQQPKEEKWIDVFNRKHNPQMFNEKKTKKKKINRRYRKIGGKIRLRKI